MGAFMESLRYDHPWKYRTFMAMVVATAFFVSFMALPDSSMLRAMGITSLQKRISATANGVYWSTRATFNRESDRVPVQAFGNVEGIDQAGKLIVVIPKGDKWVRHLLTIANAEIIDLYGAAQIVGSFRMENVRFDIYGQDQAVVWIRNAPLNVKLIEAGVAKPDPKPPTNIFDLAFAAYYWGIAKGKNI